MNKCVIYLDECESDIMFDNINEIFNVIKENELNGKYDKDMKREEFEKELKRNGYILGFVFIEDISFEVYNKYWFEK